MRRFLVVLALALGSGLIQPGTALAAEVVVKSGETLSEIAERFNISVNTLMKLNGLSNADQIEAGRRLKVPGSGAPSAAATASKAKPASRGGGGNTVVVQPGDTLSELAERHNISVQTLMKLNGLSNADTLEAGRTLLIGSGGGGGATGAGTSTYTYPRGASVHVVRSGESLSGIADGYGLSLSRLVALNGISDPDKVDVGTRLKLKGSAAPTATAAKPATTASSAPRPAAAKPTASRPASRPAGTTSSATSSRPSGSTTTTTATVAAGSSQATPTGATQVATASRQPSTATTGGTSAAATPSRPDWRTYGPLQVDWSNWQPMGGSLVAPTLNAEGQSLYLAINCSARKLNATSQTGQWKTWDDPQADFEQQLINDLCKSRGG